MKRYKIIHNKERRGCIIYTTFTIQKRIIPFLNFWKTVKSNIEHFEDVEDYIFDKTCIVDNFDNNGS